MSITSLQPSFADVGQYLAETTFCVVDLETTGGSKQDRITEIGAVKVQGGAIVGEFQTLVRPEMEIPAMIQVLTGITNDMVRHAPGLVETIGAFHTFSAGCVMVAHNARFDMGFLRRAHQEIGLEWRSPTVIDTVALARHVVMPEEVRNYKLATLAAHFHATTIPNHRALSDARATVDVLHALLERVGNLGVQTVEDLQEMLSNVTPERRAKRTWAQAVPDRPGVYWFVHDGTDALGKPAREVLYVGKSVNLKRRVRSYFSAAEQRKRIHEMVTVSTGVEFTPCATDLESEVRELRMIASHAPRYNRRSRNQAKLHWLKLTNEPFPRISMVRRVLDDGAAYWGPFTRADAAREATMLLQATFGIRQCNTRLSRRTPSASCAMAEMGRCSAPCELGDGVEPYLESVERLRSAWFSDVRPVLRSARQRLQHLIQQERFEEAGDVTARLEAFHRASVRFHRVRSLARCPEIIAAAPERAGWAVHVIRHGRLSASAHCSTRQVRAVADEIRLTAETMLPPLDGMPAGSFEEAERVAAWMETPGLRLLAATGDWAWPLHAAVTDKELPTEFVGELQRGA